MFIDEHFTCLHFFRVHGIGFGYLRDEGFLQFYSMVKGSSRGKFPPLWLVKDFGILGILWGKFLFHSFGGLSQGRRESDLSDMGVTFPKHSAKSCCISLLSINSSSELRVVLFHGMEISQEISLFKYPRVVMPRDRGSPHFDCPGCPINQRVCPG